MAQPTTSTGGTANTGTTGNPAERSQPRGQQAYGGQPQQPTGIVDRVKQSATEQLTNQKDRGIDALAGVAQAVRSSTQRLRDEKHDTIASYVDRAADQIDSWSRRLKEKDIDELLTDVQQLARRQPAVFIGSAFALGLVGARFLKSSQQNEYGYGSESRRSLYGGGAQMSTAGDRGRWSGSGDDATLVVEEVVISDIEPSSDLSSSADNRSGKSRRSGSRTERS